MNITTLTKAATVEDLALSVADATGFDIPLPNQGGIPGIALRPPFYLVQVDAELMKVLSVSGKIIGVKRSWEGTLQVAHANGARVVVGWPTDFPCSQLIPELNVPALATLGPENLAGVNLSGSADALDGSAGRFIIQTAGVDAITLAAPTVQQEGNIVEVWSATAHAHTVTCPSAIIIAGQSAKTVITFPALAGAGIVLRATGGNWLLLSAGAGGVATAATGGTPVGSVVLS